MSIFKRIGPRKVSQYYLCSSPNKPVEPFRYLAWNFSSRRGDLFTLINPIMLYGFYLLGLRAMFSVWPMTFAVESKQQDILAHIAIERRTQYLGNVRKLLLCPSGTAPQAFKMRLNTVDGFGHNAATDSQQVVKSFVTLKNYTVKHLRSDDGDNLLQYIQPIWKYT